MSRIVHCVKLDIDSEGLERPPYPGALGLRIYEQVSKAAWQQWLQHQTRLINEYRLVLAEAKARSFLAEEMQTFFFGGGELTKTEYKPPES